ncbi:MAG TPA: AAA family ATPase [Gammaproteobacteria bacterium]|nr:AAA family ATPase [Gammaproteobacteria bacterium]
MTGHQVYLDSFGLQEHPFRLSPDPRFLFLSKQHARAQAYMEATVWFSDGFVVITGEIGAGKTTLLEQFLAGLDDTVTVARIHQTQVTAVQFLQSLLVQFGVRPFNMRKAELLDALSSHLKAVLAEGRRVVIVIDEAQNLDPVVLEEIRMMSDIGPGAGRVVSIILAGQPELNATLDSPALEQLAQRTRLRFHLKALTEPETGAYIEHRLKVAGAQRQVFEVDTYPMVYRYTGGVPRLVNTLCDTAMLVAFGEEQGTVGLEEIREAVRELQWTDFASRTNRLRTGGGFGGATIARLVISAEGEEPREYPLTQGRFVIGRTADNDIELDSRFVSRHHAQLRVGPRSAVIEDLNSTNGIFLNGNRIKRRTLKDGESFVIGEHELLYRIGDFPGQAPWAANSGPTARDAVMEEGEVEPLEDEPEEEREED